MAITPDYLDGAEYGVATPNTNGGGIANTIGAAGASPVIQGTTKKTGSFAFRHQVTVAGTCYIRKTIWDASDTIVWGSFWFRMDTEINSSGPIAAVGVAAGVVAQIRWNITNNRIEAFFTGGTNQTGSTNLSLSTWYRVAWKMDVSGGTSSLLVVLYDTSGTQLDSLNATLSQAATNATYFQWGWSTSLTGDLYIDDIVCCSSGDAHPLSNIEIVALKPSADGTHSAGTNVMENQAGTDLGTAWSLINDAPPDAADYIRQAANGTSNYAEVTFENLAPSHSAVIGAVAVLSYTSETTTANNGGCIVSKDNFASSTTVWGASGSLADYSDGSTASLFYKSVLVAGVNDDTTVNALAARLGFSGDATPDPYWVDLIIQVGYVPSTGLSAAVGQTSETDSALQVAKSKAKAVGQNTETDSALTVSKRKTKAVGLNTETDSALQVARQKSRTIGQVTETDQALTIEPKLIRLVNQVQETDSALAIRAQSAATVTTVTETDSALQISRRKVRQLGLVTEADSALTISAQRRRAIGQPSETDSALAIARSKIRTISQAEETDSALTILIQGGVPVGQVTETDSALGIARSKVRTIGQISETDQALAISARKVRQLGQVLETDSALGIARSKTRAVGQILETDSAQAIARRKIRTISQAEETDQALEIQTVAGVPVGLVTETDQALTISPAHRLQLGLVLETDLALTISSRKVLTLGLAEELDLAQRILSELEIHLARDVFQTERRRILETDPASADLTQRRRTHQTQDPFADRTDRRKVKEL